MAEEGFNATLAEHKRGKGDGVFWAFDALPLSHWQAGRSDLPIEERLAFLRKLVTHDSKSVFVGMLDHWTLNGADAHAKAREIWAAGGEGIVSKEAGSPYVRDRSRLWLRMKETHIADGQIVDVAARGDGTLKHMLVRVTTNSAKPGKSIVVGTGWTVEQGRAIVAAHNVALRDEQDAVWVEISFQLSTGARRDIRGARFHRVRASKGARA